MADSTSIPSSSSAQPAPVACPKCRSTSAVTTAKVPDADSYWRCRNCGEVWNASRQRKDRQQRPGGWRWYRPAVATNLTGVDNSRARDVSVRRSRIP